jgi:hypothetical protein
MRQGEVGEVNISGSEVNVFVRNKRCNCGQEVGLPDDSCFRGTSSTAGEAEGKHVVMIYFYILTSDLLQLAALFY